MRRAHPRVAIVGGGVIGSSIAYHLASRADFPGQVVVIERDLTYAKASSALSASSIREQFSTPLNVAMSQFGLRFLQAAPELLAIEDDRPELALRLTGYLFLAAQAGVAELQANHAVQRAQGADVALLRPEEVAARFPWMSTEGVAAASLGLSREGTFNGPALLHALKQKARTLGAAYMAGEASGFERADGRIVAVTLTDGVRVPCDLAINAAGPWSASVAGWAGIDLPVCARRRMVFVIACRDELPGCPLVIDPSGIWFRREGARFLTGRSPGPGEDDPDEPPLDVDEAMFHDVIWPVLAARVPAFEALKLHGHWAGYYEMNVFDQNGVVGAHPAMENLVHAAGFSGHGMQHAPAVGRGVAELVATGGYRTLDLSPLGFGRLSRDEPMLERAVV